MFYVLYGQIEGSIPKLVDLLLPVKVIDILSSTTFLKVKTSYF